MRNLFQFLDLANVRYSNMDKSFDWSWPKSKSAQTWPQLSEHWTWNSRHSPEKLCPLAPLSVWFWQRPILRGETDWGEGAMPVATLIIKRSIELKVKVRRTHQVTVTSETMKHKEDQDLRYRAQTIFEKFNRFIQLIQF